MIKLFDGDDDQDKTPEVKPAAPSSLSITPEADPVRVEPPAAEDSLPRTASAGRRARAGRTAARSTPRTANTDRTTPRRTPGAPVGRIARSRRGYPAPHEYGPESEIPPPVTGREYPPGFSEDGPKEDVYVQAPYKPPTKGEAIRSSGLAWSAGIIFVGSIVFMLILGWGADLLLGSSPWGIVGGIVLGSLIGFIQFFRISAQIFKKIRPVP